MYRVSHEIRLSTPDTPAADPPTFGGFEERGWHTTYTHTITTCFVIVLKHRHRRRRR